MKKKSSSKPEAPRPSNTIKSFFTSSAPKPLQNNSINNETKTNGTIIENDNNNNIITIDNTPPKDNLVQTYVVDLIDDDDLISLTQNQTNNNKNVSFQSPISSQDTKTSSTQYVPSETPINTSSSPTAVADKPSPPIHPLFAGKPTISKPVQPSSTTTTVPTTTTAVKAKNDKCSKNKPQKASSASIKPLLFTAPVHSIDQSPSINNASPDPSPALLTSPPSNNQHTEPIDLITSEVTPSDLTVPNPDPTDEPDSPTPAAEPDVVAVTTGGRPRRQAVLNTLARAAQIHAAAVCDDIGTYAPYYYILLYSITYTYTMPYSSFSEPMPKRNRRASNPSTSKITSLDPDRTNTDVIEYTSSDESEGVAGSRGKRGGAAGGGNRIKKKVSASGAFFLSKVSISVYIMCKCAYDYVICYLLLLMIYYPLSSYIQSCIHVHSANIHAYHTLHTRIIYIHLIHYILYINDIYTGSEG